MSNIPVIKYNAGWEVTLNMDEMDIATICGLGAVISFFIGALLQRIGRKKLKTVESSAANLIEKVGIFLLRLGIVAAVIVAVMLLVFGVELFLEVCYQRGGCFN